MGAQALLRPRVKIRLYLDEDTIAHALIIALRAKRIDVSTAGEAFMRGRSDEEQLRYAAEQGRAIYSFNLGHFMTLHTRFLEQGLSHGGIILAENGRWSVGEQTRRLGRLIKGKTAEEMRDWVEFLSAWG